MANRHTFQTFYEETLRDQLIRIDSERSKEFKKVKAARNKGVVTGIVLALLIALGIMAMQPVASIATFVKVFLIFAVVFGVIGLVLGNHFTVLGLEKFRLPIKQKIITPIINHFNPTLTYHPEERISDEEVAESRFFQEKISQYKGDDLIEGKEGEVNFRFSEITLFKKIQKPDNNGTQTWYHHPFFKGIFLVSEFSEPIIETLIVRPNFTFKDNDRNKETLQKYAEKQTRWSNKKYMKWFPSKVKVSGKLEEVNTGDNSFDEQFFVYSTDKPAAIHLMNSALKDHLKDLKETDYEQAFQNWKSGKSGGDFQIPAPYCTIIGNKLYLAKPYNRPFFYTDLERSIVAPQQTEKYYYEIRELINLVKGMTEAFQRS